MGDHFVPKLLAAEALIVLVVWFLLAKFHNVFDLLFN
jgi:hypothetical protein